MLYEVQLNFLIMRSPTYCFQGSVAGFFLLTFSLLIWSLHSVCDNIKYSKKKTFPLFLLTWKRKLMYEKEINCLGKEDFPAGKVTFYSHWARTQGSHLPTKSWSMHVQLPQGKQSLHAACLSNINWFQLVIYLFHYLAAPNFQLTKYILIFRVLW